MSEQSIFLAALDITDPAERAAYLERACGGDAGLRSQVEALLAAHERSGEFLDVPAIEQMAGPERPADGTITFESAHQPVSEDDVLAFLQPSAVPGSLGRLAHYEVQEVLGRGGFGTVLKAFDERLHRVVAIKVMAPQLAASGAARRRFLREGRSGAAVRDEHVVNIHAVSGDDEPVSYLVMEYVAGQTLQQKLDRDGPLPVQEVLRIGHQIARGLAAAHATGVIHRDIKPANILLENGVERVKITDFGLARAADDASISQSGVVAGTPLYMAPEQARGEHIDHRADLFSLGSVLYAMCTGRPPFRASTTLAVLKRVAEDEPRPIREVNPEIPQWLVAVVTKLQAKDPADRFQTAQEVADLLAKYLAELQTHGIVSAQALAAAAPAKPTRRKHRAALLVLGAVLGVMTVGAAAFATTLWLYLTNTGEVTIDDRNNNFGPFTIRGADGTFTPVNAPRSSRLRLPPGIYHITAAGLNGETVTGWNLQSSHFLSTYSGYYEGVECTIVVGRGERIAIAIGNWTSAPPDEGWVPLFNGKDLTGWKNHPDQSGNWQVKEGLLVGQGPGVSHLFTARGDYKCFHLRAEVKLNADGNSGIFFRCEYGLDFLTKPGKRYPLGYEAQLLNTHKDATANLTGSLLKNGVLARIGEQLVGTNEWFVQEVIADGKRIILKVNDKVTADVPDDDPAFASGHLAL